MARVDTISSGLNAGVRVGPTRRTEYLATSGSLALLVLVYRMAHASWLVAPDPAGPLTRLETRGSAASHPL